MSVKKTYVKLATIGYNGMSGTRPATYQGGNDLVKFVSPGFVHQSIFFSFACRLGIERRR